MWSELFLCLTLINRNAHWVETGRLWSEFYNLICGSIETRRINTGNTYSCSLLYCLSCLSANRNKPVQCSEWVTQNRHSKSFSILLLCSPGSCALLLSGCRCLLMALWPQPSYLTWTHWLSIWSTSTLSLERRAATHWRALKPPVSPNLFFCVLLWSTILYLSITVL